MATTGTGALSSDEAGKAREAARFELIFQRPPTPDELIRFRRSRDRLLRLRRQQGDPVKVRLLLAGNALAGLPLPVIDRSRDALAAAARRPRGAVGSRLSQALERGAGRMEYLGALRRGEDASTPQD